jgi:hypothetical protein
LIGTPIAMSAIPVVPDPPDAPAVASSAPQSAAAVIFGVLAALCFVISLAGIGRFRGGLQFTAVWVLAGLAWTAFALLARDVRRGQLAAETCLQELQRQRPVEPIEPIDAPSRLQF